MITTVQYLLDALSQASMSALTALGIAVIFGIMGLVNFAQGEIIMLYAYTIVALVSFPLIVGILGTLVAAALIALAMERVAFRPLRGADPMTLLIASFALSFLIQNLVVSTIGNIPKTPKIPPLLVSSFEVGGLMVPKLLVVTIVITVVLVALLAAFFKRTSLGMEMRAAAEDPRMARLCGVRTNRVIAAAFVISGILGGVVSFMLVGQTDLVTPTMGTQPVLIGFVATVIGGMGSLVGAAFGGAILGFMTVILGVILPPELQGFRDAFVFAFVIGILVIWPHGIVRPKGAPA